MKIKTVFMGTSNFSLPTLKMLHNDKNIDLKFVITKADKINCRGKKVIYSAVKEYCITNNIEYYQPNVLKNDTQLIDILKKSDIDFFVVVSFSQILSKEILSIPNCCSINGHASLLPKYRGSSPIQYAILNGDKLTGCTTMLMDETLDTGDILEQKEIGIEDKETEESLFDKLSLETAKLIIHTLYNFHSIDKKKQEDVYSSYVPLIKKEDGFIDLTKEDAVFIERKIRAFNKWPNAYIYINNKMIKIYDADVVDNIEETKAKFIENNILIYDNSLFFKTTHKYLRVNLLKPASKKIMTSKDFINGFYNSMKS